MEAMRDQEVRVVVHESQADETRWLALVLLRGLKYIVTEIEKRYEVGEQKAKR